MGKSFHPHKFQQFTKFISTNNKPKPISPTQLKARPTTTTSPDPTGRKQQPTNSLKLTTTTTTTVRRMEQQESSMTRRLPLSDVVADCVKRWFHDALKEAKAGDVTMQVLVGQMYYSGYGVGKDEQKGKAWISRASRSRSSALKVGDKRPGYNASDSDSEDVVE